MTSDIIRYTRTSSPPLLPLFRSEHQLHLLGELFLLSAEPRSVAELAEDTGIPAPTVAREVDRLEKAGIVRSWRRGRLRLVQANDDQPWFKELQALLLKTIGPHAVLREALAGVAGVERAYIFGSWAARFAGEAGPPPRDLDLLVIGEPRLDKLYAACRRAERELGIDVNPVTRTAEEWDRADDGFLAEVRRGPLVALVEAP